MSDSDDFNYDPNDDSYPKTSPPKKHGSSSCNLPQNKTVLSLNKGEIVQLPGFKSLYNYLLIELKDFVRARVHQYTKKKRGYKVKEYVEKYRSNPQPYIPPHPTKRKMIAPPKSNIKAIEYTSNDSSAPPANYMSKKQRKAAIIAAARAQRRQLITDQGLQEAYERIKDKARRARRAVERKQRKKDNKAKRAAIKQANWEKEHKEKEINRLLKEAESYDPYKPPANYMSKKQRKAALIAAAQSSKAAARKQRRKENKAKRAAIKQANWEKHVAEKEEAIAREALIRESNARSKIFKDIKNNGKLAQSAKQIARTKRNLELIHGKPVRIISIEDNK